jgi:hypothetical protein
VQLAVDHLTIPGLIAQGPANSEAAAQLVAERTAEHHVVNILTSWAHFAHPGRHLGRRARPDLPGLALVIARRIVRRGVELAISSVG